MSNILFILGDATERGGIEKVTLNLADELTKVTRSEVLSLYKKHECVSFPINSVDVTYLNHDFEVSMYNRQLNSISGFIFDIKYIIRKSFNIRRHVKGNSFNKVVVPDIKTLLMLVIATLGTDIKILSVEHFEYDVPNKILKIVRKLLYRNERVKVIIQTDEDYSKYSWLKKDKVNIIPNMVNVSRDNDLIKNNKVIAVGRYCFQKGFDLLIDAWATIPKEKRYGWKLEIYGQGEDEEKLKSQIESLDLQGVELLPFTDNIDIVYSESKVFVLSSRFEGLGMVLIEALAHELPCISFACPAGPKTILNHGFNGLLVEEGNVAKLGESIELLINNREMRALFSSNSIESIDRFSKETVVNQWLGVINEK